MDVGATQTCPKCHKEKGIHGSKQHVATCTGPKDQRPLTSDCDTFGYDGLVQHIKYCDGISKRAKPASAISARQKITNFFTKRVVEDGDMESEPEPPKPFIWDAGDASLDNSLDDSFDLLFQDPFALDMLPPAEPRGPGARSRDAILERLGASSRPVAASKPKPQPMNVDVEIVDLADSDGEDELRNEPANPDVVNQEGEDQLPNEPANPAVVN